jgi:hypothetical protein
MRADLPPGHQLLPPEDEPLLEQLSADQARELTRLRNLSRLLDTSIRLPLIGYRIGLDPLIGLIPGVGDVIGFGLSAYLIQRAHRLDVPRLTRARMLANAALELLLGAVPLVGDLFDFGWRANSKNVALIVRHLEREREP